MADPWAGERLRALRLLLGISQVELAQAVGVSQALISKIEAGTRSAPDELLVQVAAVTGTPASFFSAVPADLPPVTLRYRKLSTARRGEVKRVEQLLVEAYRAVWTLVQGRKFLPPELPVATGDLTGEEIEAFAARTREALALEPDGPVPNVTRVLERAGIVVAPLVLPGDLDGAGEAEAVGHFGASAWPGPGAPALIGFFAGGPGDRQRFTLAHELGHLVLHTRRPRALDPETEAHRFAGAFLVPAARLEEACAGEPLTLRDYAQLKARWGVSVQALIMRSGHLGLIDATRRQSLFRQLSARGWRTEEPVTVNPETPALFEALLRNQFGDGRRLYVTAGEQLGFPSFLLGQLAPKVA